MTSLVQRPLLEISSTQMMKCMSTQDVFNPTKKIGLSLKTASGSAAEKMSTFAHFDLWRGYLEAEAGHQGGI